MKQVWQRLLATYEGLFSILDRHKYLYKTHVANIPVWYTCMIYLYELPTYDIPVWYTCMSYL